jgi:mannitol-specific phosphotransferase system IIBC component
MIKNLINLLAIEPTNNKIAAIVLYIFVAAVFVLVPYLLIVPLGKQQQLKEFEHTKGQQEQQQKKEREIKKEQLRQKLTLEHEVIKEILSAEAPEIFKCPTCGANVTKKNTDKFCMYCGAKLK